MTTPSPTPIALTTEEHDVVRRIDFTLTHDTLRADFHRLLEESCTAAGALTKSLLARGAILDVRLAHFADRDRNIGLRRSRQEVFEDNGTRGDQIFEHGTDGCIYVREEVGGLLMGGFEPVAKPWGMDGIPADFKFSLCPRTGSTSVC
jgi:hypothetical protein